MRPQKVPLSIRVIVGAGNPHGFKNPSPRAKSLLDRLVDGWLGSVRKSPIVSNSPFCPELGGQTAPVVTFECGQSSRGGEKAGMKWRMPPFDDTRDTCPLATGHRRLCGLRSSPFSCLPRYSLSERALFCLRIGTTLLRRRLLAFYLRSSGQSQILRRVVQQPMKPLPLRRPLRS
jgi:hypothetical protein